MIAGRMDHHRATLMRLDHTMAHAPDTAARLGQPAEDWYAVWLDTYRPIIDPINGMPAASYAGIPPRRIRRITPTTSTPSSGEETP